MKLHCAISGLILLGFSSITDGANILLSAPFGTKSHKNMHVPILCELIQRGHNVTSISNYPTNELQNFTNFREIVIPELIFDLSQYPNAFDQLLSQSILGSFVTTTVFLQGMFDFPEKITRALYGHPEVQALLTSNRSEFDLIILSQAGISASYPLVWHFKSPFIVISPNIVFPGYAHMIGDNEHTGYLPFIFSSFSGRMNLWQRVANTAMTKAFGYVSNDWPLSIVRSVVQNEFEAFKHCPPLIEVAKQVSLIFTNTHPSLSYARPQPPQVIEIGGIHCKPPKPLDEKLNEFVSADAGFILFGIGSLQKMEDMPESLIQVFFDVFSRLPQRVVWQWKGRTRNDLPGNVLALPWLPQQDLLGHEKCRLFLTHGGLNSQQEAVYHGVPILGLPFGIDHHVNLRRASDDGYAKILEWRDINRNSLYSVISEIVNSAGYRDAASRTSKVFRDDLYTPLERALFWTEYVLRHKNETDHLRLGSRHLKPYEQNLIDVYFVTFTIIFFVMVFLTLACVLTWRFLRRLYASNGLTKLKQN